MVLVLRSGFQTTCMDIELFLANEWVDVEVMGFTGFTEDSMQSICATFNISDKPRTQVLDKDVQRNQEILTVKSPMQILNKALLS